MRNTALLLAAGVTAVCVGCHTAQPMAAPLEGVKPALLVGPEATGATPPPVELPARVCLRAAEEFDKNGQVEDAIRLYEKARADDPTTARHAGRRLAVLYDKAGDFTRSAAEYEVLLQANPKDSDLLSDFGYSHYCRGDWANAEAYASRATDADSNNKRAWCNLGLAQAQQEKWDDSFRSFSRAVRPAEAHCNVAFVMAARGRTDDARARYAEALQLDPGQRMARAAIAKLDSAGSGVVTASTPRPRPASKYDAAEAAAKVPTFAELEAKLIQEGRLPGSGGTQPIGVGERQP